MTWRPSSAGEEEPVRLTASFDRLARRLGGPGAAAMSAIFGRWEEAVGEGLAAHARPLSLRGSTLVVAVDEGAWATQIRLLAPDLIGRLGEVAGEGAVTSIDVVVRPRNNPV